MFKYGLLFLVIFQTISASSQELKGRITDIFESPVTEASIVVFQNKKLIGYSYSDKNGSYQITFKTIQKDSLKIVVNALGFKTQQKNMFYDVKQPFIVNFKLEEKVEQLNEVVLEAWQKIKIKRDTITFKVKAFKDNTEQVVEDLLKNLPGVEVLNNGLITVNGKPIDKLLIEGDDLFDDKYKLLSKNLDANTIDEVQILNNFEDNPVLKSFQESQKVALNLILKEDKRNVWFGNIDIGLGTNKRYNNAANIGLLKKKIKFLNLLNHNNIGNTAVSQVKNNRLHVTASSRRNKIEKQNNEIVNIDNLSDSNFSNNEDVFNKSFLNSLSFVTNLSKNTKLRNITYYTFDEIQKQNANFIQYFVEPGPISYTEKNNIEIKDILFATEIELKHLGKSKKTYYTYNFSFENNPNRKRGELLFNDNLFYQKQDDKKYNMFNHVNITKKLNDNVLFLFYGYFGVNNTKQNYAISPDEFNSDDSYSSEQFSDSPLNYYGFFAKTSSKKAKGKYDIEFSANVDRDKIYSDFKSDDFNFLNNTDYKKIRLNLAGKYAHYFTKKIVLNTALGISQNFINLNNQKKEFFFLNPKIQLSITKTVLGSFRFSYGFRNNLPEIKFLTEDFLLRNYRSFSRGVNDVVQTENHSFTFSYTLGKFKKQFLIHSYLFHNFSNKSFGTKSLIDENFSLNQYTIIGGRKNTGFNFGITKYINNLSTSVKLSTIHNWGESPSIINEIDGKIKNYTSIYRTQGTTYFKIPLNFKFAFQYNHSSMIFNNQTSFNNYFEAFLKAILNFSNNWIFQFENNFYSTEKNNFLFSNVIVQFNPKSSKFSFRLTAKNLFNIEEYSNVYISEIERNEYRFSILPRFFLMNVKYRF